MGVKKPKWDVFVGVFLVFLIENWVFFEVILIGKVAFFPHFSSIFAHYSSIFIHFRPFSIHFRSFFTHFSSFFIHFTSKNPPKKIPKKTDI
jgi:hypothetical protein